MACDRAIHDSLQHHAGRCASDRLSCAIASQCQAACNARLEASSEVVSGNRATAVQGRPPERPMTRSALTDVTPSWFCSIAFDEQERLLDDDARLLA